MWGSKMERSFSEVLHITHIPVTPVLTEFLFYSHCPTTMRTGPSIYAVLLLNLDKTRISLLPIFTNLFGISIGFATEGARSAQDIRAYQLKRQTQ